MTHIIMNIFAINKGNPLISSLIKYPKLYAPINKQVIICFGKVKHTFIQRNVVYIPIYLVVHHKTKQQIGLLEFDKNDESLNLSSLFFETIIAS